MIGVIQNQNCSTTPNNWPTSRKKTFSTPSTMPSPKANKAWMANTGKIPRKAHPGKESVSSKNAVNNPKIIAKFKTELSINVNGKQNRGKLSFFRRLAFSMKIFLPSRLIK